MRPRAGPGGRLIDHDDAHLLETLLSSWSLALVGADLEGRINRWSRGAATLYGWTEEEVLGRHLSLLMPPQHAQDVNLLQRLHAGEDLPPFETVRVGRDGEPLHVELHLLLLRDEDGRPTATIGLHRDMRRARRAEAALEATAEELRARFQDSPVAQSRVDLRGRVLATNRAMQELLGYDGDRLLGRDAVELYDETERPGVRDALRRLASGEVPSLVQEHAVVRADGARLRAITTATLVHDETGRPQLAASVEDVTALRAAEERVRIQAERFEVLLQTMPVAVFTYDLQGICTSSRGKGLAALGFSDDELVGRSLLDTYEHDPEVRASLQAGLEGRASDLTAHAGGREWQGAYRPLRNDQGELVGAMGIAIDVTDAVMAEREVRAREARFRSLLQHASDLALVIDERGHITYASPAVNAHLGYEPDDLLGRRAIDFDHPDDHEAVRAALEEIRGRHGATARCELRVRHGDGTWRWADHVLTNLVDDPAVAGYVVNVRETTERRRAEEELRRLAVKDSLTGLANRTLLLDRVGQALASGHRAGVVTGLVVLDVVGMSGLNERLGQAGGDQVLRTLGARLAGALRGTDSVARVGGDEFVVLVQDVASAEDLRTRAATLLEVAADPIDVDGKPVAVRLQAGSAMSPAADAGALLAAAERAVAHSDRVTSRVVVRSASSEVDPKAVRTAAKERLREGIAAGELVLQYQPVLDLATEEPRGAEALVRWQHPERGLLPPSEFIPLAEESGLVVELGEWVLREACARLAAWEAAGRSLSIGVNLSPRQLVGEAFPELLRTLLGESRVRPDRLVLEVTESALMDDPGAPDVLRMLRDMGVRLALDDFGTGYSSLTYLKRFPVDAIKIDRSFVSGLGRDPDDEAIVASVVSLARAVGKTVVAEGVETLGQLAALRAMGVDQAQGFLWSRALPVKDLELWLDQRRPGVVRLPAVAGPDRIASTVSAGDDEQRILALHREGASLHTIAAALNAEGRRTPAGPRWTTKTVARVIAGLVRTR